VQVSRASFWCELLVRVSRASVMGFTEVSDSCIGMFGARLYQSGCMVGNWSSDQSLSVTAYIFLVCFVATQLPHVNDDCRCPVVRVVIVLQLRQTVELHQKQHI